MKRIVLTGGGSAGHVTPHLALLPHLLEEGYDVHYFGTEDGIEHKMMTLPGVTYHAIKSGKLRRYHDWKNFTDPFRVIAGVFQASRLMKELNPDICFSKGGFVSVPVVIGAARHHVPVLCHESDLTPGLANKICALLHYPILAAEEVRNCREELKDIRWENAAVKLRAAYDRLIAGRR